MKIPLRDVAPNLANKRHMYICYGRNYSHYSYAKCQTFKPYHIDKGVVVSYHIEPPNIKRNPFVKTTLIDLDKIFITSKVEYSDELKTGNRTNICDELYDTIDGILSHKPYRKIPLDEDELCKLNPKIKLI